MIEPGPSSRPDQSKPPQPSEALESMSQLQRKFDELAAENPDFFRDRDLQERLKPLFDPDMSTTLEQQLAAQRSFNQAYDKWKQTMPQAERGRSTPQEKVLREQKEAALQKKRIEEKIDIYKSYVAADVLEKPDKKVLLEHLRSTDPQVLKRAEEFIDAEIVRYREDEISRFTKKDDFYSQLGFKKPTNQEEISKITQERIQKRYRKWMKKFHPDKVKDLPEKVQKKAGENIPLVQDAYNTLSDPDKKAAYDRQLLWRSQGNYGRTRNPWDGLSGMGGLGDLFGGSGLGGINDIFERMTRSGDTLNGIIEEILKKNNIHVPQNPDTAGTSQTAPSASPRPEARSQSTGPFDKPKEPQAPYKPPEAQPMNRRNEPPRPSQSNQETPEQKAAKEKRDAERQREREISDLEGKISSASNITEILNALYDLQQLGHMMKIENPDRLKPGEPYYMTVSAQALLDQVLAVGRNANATHEELLALSEKLPRILSIRYKVQSELRGRKDALDILQKVEPSVFEIIHSLKKCAKMNSKTMFEMNGDMQTVIFQKEIEKIVKIRDEKYNPSRVNELIGDVTPWNDLDLKVYYEIQQGLAWGDSKKPTFPVPESIRVRYEQYKLKRAS